MSFYNPKVYNYTQLNDADKKTFNTMIEFMLEPMIEKIEYLKKCRKTEKIIAKQFHIQESISILTKMKTELVNNLIEYLVSTIDNYDGVLEDEDLTETDDYFYQCPAIEELESRFSKSDDDDEDDDEETEEVDVYDFDDIFDD